MLSTDVGGEQRSAQYRPRKAAARQEVVFAGLFPLGKGEANEECHEQIACDRDQVKYVKRGQCQGLGSQGAAVPRLIRM